MPYDSDPDADAAVTEHCVVQYLYVHTADEAFSYPTGRSHTDPTELAAMYLECALVQAASLRLRAPACRQVLVTNVRDGGDATVLGRRGVQLVQAMADLGVEMRYAPYAHAYKKAAPEYASVRYVFDAIEAVAGTAAPTDRLWFVDVDCVWPRPERVLAAAPSGQEIGCLYMHYPPDWDLLIGTTPTTVGEYGIRIEGRCAVPVQWIGGELLVGTPSALRALVAACESIERRFGEDPTELPTEEHLLSLVGGLGGVEYRDLSSHGRRLLTGGRHGGPPRDYDPADLGLWHLPMEKGLSFRRAANGVLAGGLDELERDLADLPRAMARFNAGDPRFARRVRDYAWLVKQRLINRT